MSHMHAQPPMGPQPLPGVDAIVAVGSGKGGVGKTTLAVNLALALSKLGHKVGLLDADVYGPNVPLMLGSSSTPRIVGDNRIEPLERYGIKVISVGFLNPGDKPLIWRGPMLHQMIREFVQRVEWGTLDYLVVDLPPGTGDVAISLIQTVPVTGSIVVSTPSRCLAAGRAQGHRDVSPGEGGHRRAGGEHELLSSVRIATRRLTSSPRAAASAPPNSSGSRSSGRSRSIPTSARAATAAIRLRSMGPDSPHAKSIYAFAQQVKERVQEIRAASPQDVIQIM